MNEFSMDFCGVKTKVLEVMEVSLRKRDEYPENREIVKDHHLNRMNRNSEHM